MQLNTSHAVHGNWQDLIQHHLAHTKEGFAPSVEWCSAAPERALHAALFSVEALKDYLPKLPACSQRDHLSGMLEDAMEKILKVDKLHEEFLQKQQTQTDSG